MPPTAGFFKCLVRLYSATTAGTSYSQFHGKDRETHKDQENEVQKYKKATTIFSGNIGKTPDISNPGLASYWSVPAAPSVLEMCGVFHMLQGKTEAVFLCSFT